MSTEDPKTPSKSPLIPPRHAPNFEGKKPSAAPRGSGNNIAANRQLTLRIDKIENQMSFLTSGAFGVDPNEPILKQIQKTLIQQANQIREISTNLNEIIQVAAGEKAAESLQELTPVKEIESPSEAFDEANNQAEKMKDAQDEKIKEVEENEKKRADALAKKEELKRQKGQEKLESEKPADDVPEDAPAETEQVQVDKNSELSQQNQVNPENVGDDKGGTS